MIKEEVLAERVALSVLKSGEVKGTLTEKVLSHNEFTNASQMMRPLVNANTLSNGV